MLPFSGLFFFCIFIPALIPAVILGLSGKPIKYYGMLFTIAFLIYCFDTTEKRLALLAFWLLECVLVQLYLRVRKSCDKRYVLWIYLALALVPILYIKIGPFVSQSFFPVLGVSYMSFRAIQMLIDIYDGLITDVKVFDFTYFLLFFPCISSGPIDRSRRFFRDINTPMEKEEYISRLKHGIFMVFTGFLYNFVISRLIYLYVLQKLPETGFLPTLGYMYGYILYLFFDFAGYSGIAVGVSYILGVISPDNFNMPFISRDLKEFWSRWHMSLSSWLRDYVYTRIVMASLRKKTFKDPHTGSYIGYAVTMMIMGIWHGLSLNYIVYGAYHGGLMCLNDVLDNKWKSFRKIKRDDRWHPLLSFITFNIVAFGLLIFSGRLF